MPSLPYWLFPGDDRPPGEIDDEITEELQLHLDLMAEEQMRQGVGPDEARRQAAERFGDFDSLVRQCRVEKQGDAPMLKRIQAVLTLLLLVAVVWLGVRDYMTAATTTQYMNQTTSLLLTIQEDLHSFKRAPEVIWEPPAEADPKTILEEARADAQAERYMTALAKQLWYHNNAVRLRPSLSAVRLSFALSSWYDLGLVYPPAMDELRSIRDSLELRASNGADLGKAFHELSAINRQLGEQQRTVASFAALDAKNTDAARRAFHFAKAALIETEAYELLLKYVHGKRDYERIEMAFNALKDKPSLEAIAKKNYQRSTATLIAILVIGDRQEEAQKIAALARSRMSEEDFQTLIDEALEGTLPPGTI